MTPGALRLTDITFAHPTWLIGIPCVCIVMVWLWWRYDAQQQTALAKFVALNLRLQLTQSLSVARRRLQRGLYLAALMLLIVALAAPQLGFHWEQVSRRGNNVVFAVDTSRSMSTPDVKPDRLTRAKLGIDDFLDKLDGDAVGLVAFAGNAFLACPITLDYGAFRETVNALDTNTIARGGTNITSAIHQAEAALARRPGTDKILILITDGEDLEGDSLEAAQAAAHDQGMKIFTIGVGTAAGDLIPLTANPADGFVKDDSGAYVKSHLDEAALTTLATATGGFYAPLGRQGEGLEAVYEKILGPMAKHELAARQQRIYNQRFQWPLSAALVCLLGSLMIGNRRRRARASKAETPATTPKGVAPRAAVSSVLALWVLVVAWHSAPADAASDSDKTVAEFNEGTSAYKAGDFPKAAKAFTNSISHSPSNDPQRLADQEDAYYNLGNALYRAGQKAAQSAPQQAIDQWTQSLKAYDSALQLQPKDADSKFNRDYVKRKLDELKNQQQQNPQNQQGQGKGQGQGQGQGKGDGQGQGQGQDKQNAQNQQQPSDQKQDQKQDQSKDQKQNPQQAQNQPQDNSGQDQHKQDPQKQDQQSQSGQQAPQNAQNQPQPAAPKHGTPQGAAQQPQPGDAGSEERTAGDDEHQPGQMSREEARELLDSVKGEEKKMPTAQRGDNDSNEKPYKNW